MLRQVSHNERAQAFCTNFLLQAMNAQGLGTRTHFVLEQAAIVMLL